MKTINFEYSGRPARIDITVASPSVYTVGDRAEMSVTIDDTLVRTYADQYGDRNPIHLDDEAGKASIFRGRIAHGMLSFNFFSTILGAGFPGPGTIFTGVSDWKFTAPVAIGDVLSIQIQIASERKKGNGSYDLSIAATAINQKGKSVMSGHLGVIAPKLG